MIAIVPDAFAAVALKYCVGAVDVAERLNAVFAVALPVAADPTGLFPAASA